MGFLEDLWEGLTKPKAPQGYKPSYSNGIVKTTAPAKSSSSNKNKTSKPAGKTPAGWKPSYQTGLDNTRKYAKPYTGSGTGNGATTSPKRTSNRSAVGKRDGNWAKIPLNAGKGIGSPQPNTRQLMEADNLPSMSQASVVDEMLPDPMDELLGGLTDFQGPSVDMDAELERTKAEIMATLDEMLGGQLSGINNARGQVQSSFNTSDQNLASMHSAFQNDIATSGKAAYEGIGNQLTGNLTQSRDSSVNALQALKAKDQADQSAMLKNLGIQEAAPGIQSDVYDDASANIIGRTATDLTSANQQQANSQTFNQGLATTTGMQGMQRRAALNQQMQGLMGQLSEKESDVRGNYAQARSRAEQDLAQMGMQANAQGADQAWRQYTYEQDRIMDRANRMEDMNFRREQMDMEAQIEAQNAAAKGPEAVSGFAGLTQDLANNYGPQMAQKVTAALSQVYNSSELEVRSDSDVKRDPTALAVNALVRRGIPESVALHAVTNYNQLGRTSKYTPQ